MNTDGIQPKGWVTKDHGFRLASSFSLAGILPGPQEPLVCESTLGSPDVCTALMVALWCPRGHREPQWHR